MRDEIDHIIMEKTDCPAEFACEATNAIIAALPDMIAPLVWEGNDDIGEGGEIAVSSIGYVFHAITDGWSPHRSMNWNDAIGLEAAKEAANAHHRARIMAAFTVGSA